MAGILTFTLLNLKGVILQFAPDTTICLENILLMTWNMNLTFVQKKFAMIIKETKKKGLILLFKNFSPLRSLNCSIFRADCMIGVFFKVKGCFVEIVTKEFKVYNYNELDEKAKEFAFDRWYECQEFSWSVEYRDTMNKFCDTFGIKLRNWNVDAFGYNFSIQSINIEDELPDGNTKKERVRIVKYLLSLYKAKVTKDWESCPFTGFCADCDILEPFRDIEIWKFIPSSIYDFFRECFDRFFSAWSKDMEYSYSKENFEENYAREETYLENGGIFA